MKIPEEVKEAYLNAKQPRPLHLKLRPNKYFPSAEWQTLFNFYNANSGQQHLSLGCQPCYSKVYSWVTIEMEKQPLKEISDIDTTTKEGKYLLAALAIITTQVHPDKTPFECLEILEKKQKQMFAVDICSDMKAFDNGSCDGKETN